MTDGCPSPWKLGSAIALRAKRCKLWESTQIFLDIKNRHMLANETNVGLVDFSLVERRPPHIGLR